MKKGKAPRFSHTSDNKYGMGDFYGTGIKQKFGRVREGMGMKTLSKSKLKVPPKTLA